MSSDNAVLTASRAGSGAAVEVPPPARGFLQIPRKTIISLGLLALIWQGLSYVLPSYMVPGWEKIFQELLEIRFDFVAITVARVFLALAISFAIGLAGAMLTYTFPRTEGYLLPQVKLLMAVPVVCWIMFAVLWFRGLEFRIGFVLVVVCAPIFWIDFLDSMKSVPKELREMLWSLRPSRGEFFRKLILPATMPSIITSWKINLSLAIRVVTMAELVGATTGIGYGLVIAQTLLSVAEVFAWTIILVVILFACQMVVSWVEARALRWRD
jgi:ABC-type nitrate/sulfonate/bicarbonate transport system permease component